MTLQVRLVLELLLAEPDRERFGLEIVDGTGLPPGTIYPILARLEHSGWLESRWEQIDPHDAGRPRRRYYLLTATGVAEAGAAVARYQPARGAQTPGSPARGKQTPAAPSRGKQTPAPPSGSTQPPASPARGRQNAPSPRVLPGGAY